MTGFYDAHVHPPVAALLDGPLAPYLDGLQTATGAVVEPVDPVDLADYYRSQGGRALLLGWDLETAGNRRPFSTADVADLVASAPDVFDGLGAVDTAKGALAVSQVHEAARRGMKGIAVHPAAQGMDPDGRLVSPVWEAAAEYGLVCLMHTGTTRLGFGSPGGAGVRLAAGNPIHADGIAARFPSLRIVLAHTGPLWQTEALAVAEHKQNVFLCPTNTTPDGWPGLAEAATGPLGERILFGSSYPLGDPAAMATSWRESVIPDDVVERILIGNAAELLS